MATAESPAQALARLRALKLGPARCKEIATKASHARKSYKRKMRLKKADA